ncbi:precorrin-2 C(20)-methyltransferase [Actibacterium sp. 188UL27-1]|uniref:precorrin-2 C(20)-methyltransferase n=1 Tax=Actibacterium sp. 188UL27-1 TaxID=2786961 RepID=UPI00195901D5|nr:precorrin-2 C(20)-methyltransferase [Actibacterium sp. 188UL27-1]MBM7068623.1 precorrin-2 C(20)-methyltransferase [Actibacterium sp. 188UL27-1]
MTGTLYGVGLGPGDPELMTLKAHRLICKARVIAYPTLDGADSFARGIAADAIPPDAQEIRIDLPMTTARAPAQAAYDQAAQQISTILETGQDVVALCEGDPFFYGSFMYLHARLADRFTVRIVPGVTSMTACAGRAGLPLASRNDVVSVIPAPLSEPELADRFARADTAVVMKLGRHLPKLRRVIDAAGLTDQALYVERASLPQERCLPLAQAPEKAPYFSMILVTKGADPWLQPPSL